MLTPFTEFAAAAVRISVAGLNDLTTDLTANGCFAEMVGGQGGPNGYRPTLRADLNPWNTLLADAYDAARELQRDPRRAFRG